MSIISCTSDKTKLLSEKQFTEIFRDSLKKLYPDPKYIIKQDLEIYVKSEEVEFTHYLNNAYSSYKMEPDSLNSVLDMYVKSAKDLYKEELPIQKDKIVPVIKDAAYLEEIAMSLNKRKDSDKPIEWIYEKYNEKLIILYGEDGENGISYFTKERFNESGINKNSLLPLALKNLDTLLPEIQRNGDEGLYMITAGGNYEASLLLLNDLWTKENMPVDGQIVVAIPTRDLLFVTGSKNRDGIKKIRSMAEQAWQEGPYQLLPDLFIWTGKKFELFN